MENQTRSLTLNQKLGLLEYMKAKVENVIRQKQTIPVKHSPKLLTLDVLNNLKK